MTRWAWWVLAAVTAVCALGWLGNLAWPLELWQAWGLHLQGALLFSVLVLARTRFHPLARWLGILGLLHLVMLVRGLPPRGMPTDAEPVFTVVTWNTLHGERDRSEGLAGLLQADADVVVVTELDFDAEADLAPLDQTHPYTLRRAEEGSEGLGIWSRLPLREGRLSTPSEDGLRVQADAWIGDVHLAATHLPVPKSGRNVAIREDLVRHLASLEGPLVVAGDLNATPWSYGYRLLRREAGLRYGGTLEPTFPGFLGPFGLPIDHVLVSPPLRSSRAEVLSAWGSDHRAVRVEVLRAP